MTIHSIDSMPQDKPLLVVMQLCDDILKEYYGSDIFYYVCVKDRGGGITEASGEEYATFSDNDKIELLGWVSFDELNELFNIKGEQK